MDEFRRIKLGGDLSSYITSMWMAEDKIELLDFEMVMIQALSAQIIGAAQELKVDPVKLANVIHKGTLRFIERMNKR